MRIGDVNSSCQAIAITAEQIFSWILSVNRVESDYFILQFQLQDRRSRLINPEHGCSGGELIKL